MTNLKFSKWLRWIEEIHKDTQEMLINKTIHNRYLEIIKANKDIQQPSDFHEWSIKNYGSYIVMAIRRQMDTSNDVTSLKRLLKELENNPELLTKKWYRALYSNSTSKLPISPEAWADSDFEEHAGKLDHFDPRIVKADLKKLDRLSKKITRFANKGIAHRTKVKTNVTFKEVNIFIKAFEEILKKYILLFTASGYVSLTPQFQYDWDEIFKQPWVK